MSDYFPQSVLIEILLRLPVKSLVRFTLVSKTWQAFITSPDFVATHLSRVQYDHPTYKNRSREFLIRYYSELDEGEHYELCPDNFHFLNRFSEIKFPLKSREGFNQIVGSCNGIVCLCDNFFGEFSTSPIILWNPSIQKHVVLPLPRIEPSTNCFVLGFGFDLQRNDYKVVRLLYGKGFYRKPLEAEVFSLRNKNWKSGNPLALKGFINDIGQSQVFLNGIVHWMAYQGKGDGDIQNSILGFDCSDEEFMETVLPDHLADPKCNPNLHLVAHGGCLGMISYNKSFCSIWEMKEYGSAESWTHLYYFEWTYLYDLPLDKGMAKVVGFRNTGELLVTMLANKNVSQRANGSPFRPAIGGLVSYNPMTRQVSKHPRHHGWMDSFRVLDYVETLSLLDHVSCICPKEKADKDCLEVADDTFQGGHSDEVHDFGEFNDNDDESNGGDVCMGEVEVDDYDEVHDFGEFNDNDDENNGGDVCMGEVDVDNYEAADDIDPMEESDDSWVLVPEKDEIANAEKND